MEWGIAQDTVMVELVDTGRGNVADGLLPTLRVTFKIPIYKKKMSKRGAP